MRKTTRLKLDLEFSVVDDVKSSKKRVARLRFRAYAIGLRTNDIDVVHLPIVNNTRVTFPTTGSNQTNGKMDEFFFKLGKKECQRKKYLLV